MTEFLRVALPALLLAMAGQDGPAPTATTPARPVRQGPDRSAVLTEIRRTVLSDRVRVTLELDRDTAYRTERIGNPPRVLVDLADTLPGRTVFEGTLRYSDDVVRNIRVGRYPNQVTRVVLDLEGVERYALSTLSNPYRIVVDCERGPATASASVDSEHPSSALSARDPVPRAATSPLPPAPRVEPVTGAAAGKRSTPQSTGGQGPSPSEPRPAADRPAPPIRAPHSLARQLGLGVTRIVIDPGHGGRDPGAIGMGLSEASIVLDVSLRLEALLTQSGIDVVLTRRGDEFVPLEERPAIANRVLGDLFLSIHANGSRNRTARGIESYVLDIAADPGAEAVAAAENASTDRTVRDLPDLVKTIMLNSKVEESRGFARQVERAMAARLRTVNRGLRDLGVKQAPFLVLAGATMPAVLVEISFITNSQEGRLLKSEQYRQKIADALFEAVNGYRRSLKNPLTTVRQ